MKHTISKEQIRVMIFKEGNTWYGVALEFNIVESGNDPREVMLMLDEAVRGYIKTASKISGKVLTPKIDPEYEKLWNLNSSNKKIKSPYKIYSSGFLSLSSLAKA